ncbi:DUF4232 domain-containing protein [Nonomuraea rhodomycinica]|uniref:DUF4232 domain-containing protein n=1 Tax=Nonomuraea rhodomycinica TaxID=1712872 RepID=A0A7Y6IQ16_9ACTN|nr:DUF4232 domain-containing protein [Nonomuraea rhodomycinica]NUW42314.1 DUF4232 domain-containing protein [Nonomuraea rhodomycinica]
MGLGLLVAGTAFAQTRPVSPAAPRVAAQAGPAASDPCSSDQLEIRFGRIDPGAGNRYVPLTFTNVSGASCVLSGHPGVALLDAAGAALAVTVRHVDGPGAVATLKPGGSVRSVLHWTVVEPGCVSPAGLRAEPPAGGTGVTLPLPEGRVCGGVDVTPVG